MNNNCQCARVSRYATRRHAAGNYNCDKLWPTTGGLYTYTKRLYITCYNIIIHKSLSPLVLLLRTAVAKTSETKNKCALAFLGESYVERARRKNMHIDRKTNKHTRVMHMYYVHCASYNMRSGWLYDTGTTTSRYTASSVTSYLYTRTHMCL